MQGKKASRFTHTPRVSCSSSAYVGCRPPPPPPTFPSPAPTTTKTREVGNNTGEERDSRFLNSMLSTAQGHLRTDHTLRLLHQCKTQLASKKLRLKTKNKEKWCRMEVGSWCVQQHFSDHHLPAVVFMFQFFIFLPFFLSFHFFTVAEVIAGVVRV